MDEIEAAESQVQKRVGELKATIDGIPPDPKYPWFRDMLSAILESALTDYDLVLASLERPATMTAWARRCLLELRVICEYVLASEPNATTFHEELLVDAKEFYKAVTEYTKSGHQQVVTLLNELIESLPTGPQRTSLKEYARKEAEAGAQTKESEAAIVEYHNLLEDLGIEDRRNKKFYEMASPKLKGDFLSMNKICSKLAHRTAFSIGLKPSPDLAELITTFKAAAFSDVISIFTAIEDHLKKHGVRPITATIVRS